ncbi:MAG: hypothetical protein HRF40_08560 [Nitrososphaera sp.]
MTLKAVKLTPGMFGRRKGAGVSYQFLAYLTRKELEPDGMTYKNNGSLDDGIVAFGVWLNAQDKEPQDNSIPMSLSRFIKDKLVTIYDRILGKTVKVNIIDGIPSCEECNSTDCSHVGFAICVEQMNKRSRIE